MAWNSEAFNEIVNSVGNVFNTVASGISNIGSAVGSASANVNAGVNNQSVNYQSTQSKSNKMLLFGGLGALVILVLILKR